MSIHRLKKGDILIDVGGTCFEVFERFENYYSCYLLKDGKRVKFSSLLSVMRVVYLESIKSFICK